MNRRMAVMMSVVAAFALLLALAGTSYAASHSHKANASVGKKHKKPKRGPRGARGPAGKEGKEGKAGKDGAQGKEGKEGKQGLSGFVGMYNFDASGGAPVTTSEPQFEGESVTEKFDAKTAAHVVATLDLASEDGAGILSEFGICYAPVGGPLTYVSFVYPEFEAPAQSYFAQTVSGVVKGLPPGTYEVGLCVSNESANIEHGTGTGTALFAELP